MKPGPFPDDLFDGKHFAVLGLGLNGLASVRALLKMGARIQAWDDTLSTNANTLLRGENKLPDRLETQDALTIAPFETLEGFDGLIMSPGIPHLLPKPHPFAHLARAAHVPIVSDAELLFQAVRRSSSRARFVSITGTNGKSTTTVLLTHLLKQAGVLVAAGGNLGPAALSLPLLPNDGIYVLEMSSYMLERLRTFRADAASLLNLSPDHLDRHGGMSGYRAAKEHVFDRMGPYDLAVVGVDDPDCHDIAKRLQKKGIQVKEITTHAFKTTSARPFGEGGLSALPGTHNLQNALTAEAIATHFGLSPAQVNDGMRSFQGLQHRQQRVDTLDGICFINDSKATNAEAAIKALECYDRVIWIAGGQKKEGGIQPIVPLFSRIAKAFLIGKDGQEFCTHLREHGVCATYVETLDRAIDESFVAAKSHGVNIVLLSPACASFDQFSSFEARGTAFIDRVKSLSSRVTISTRG